MVKFAHMSDCHLGSWSNHPDMREYPVIAFEKAMDECKKEGVDFIIIAGDLFDTSLPSIDILKRAAARLRNMKESGIPVYVVPGSHDYSPTGKTMVSVLEEAGLLVDVCKFDVAEGKVFLKFTVDEKTGTKIAGLMGRKGGLDIDYYKNIDRSVENESGFKIFVFHAALADYRPDNMKDMLAVSLNDLPKNFDYYATGHVHKRFFDKNNMIVFPGELFPTSFDELEAYNGSFVIAEEKDGKLDVSWKDVRLFDVELMKFDVTGKSASAIETDIINKIESENLMNNIVLLKLYGTIEAGKISDINFNEITKKAREKGAAVVKRSTSGISIKEFEEIKVAESLSTEQIEKGLIEQHAEQLRLSGVDDIEDFVLNLMSVLKEEKAEDETNATFEDRLKLNAKKVLGL
jgi:exonuclease SbcD